MSKAALLKQFAAQAAGDTASGAGAVGALYGASPLVQQYERWSSGFGYGQSLPRPLEDFLAGAFGPLAPVRPFGIDKPDEESGRPGPRRMQYPVGYNLPRFPGDLKLVSFSNLRAHADLYSVARTCIQVRKQEVLGLEWDIVPTPEAHKAMRSDKAAQADFAARRTEAMSFWRRPDPNYNNFTSWLGALLEDVFVVDAVSAYLHATRERGKGPFHSNLAALEVLDGTTIRPMLGITGASPRPPAVAFQQYLWGVPRSEFVNVPLESDDARIQEVQRELADLGEPVQEYRGDQLLYSPYVTRAWTPYGFPPVEQAIIPVQIGLRKQEWQLDFFVEGSIPGMFVVAPPDWTPNQIRTLQDALNTLGGDQAMKHRVIVLPGGTKPELQKPPELASAADTHIMENVLMSFDVKPFELGLLPGGRSSGLGGSGLMRGQQQAGRRHSLRPLCRWLSDSIFNYVLHNVFEQRDMLFKFLGIEDEEDEEKKTSRLVTLRDAGLKTGNEVRDVLGDEPINLPEMNEPLIVAGNTVVPLAGVIARAQASQDAAEALAAHPPGSTPDESEPGAEGEEKPTPPKGPAPRGGKPAAGTSAGGNAPDREDDAHADGKAALDELEQLRTYLRHGKDVTKFRTDALPATLVAEIGKRVAAGDKGAYSWARGELAKASVPDLAKALDQRQRTVDKVMAVIAARLGELSAHLAAGAIDEETFLDDAEAILEQGYHEALMAGAHLEGGAREEAVRAEVQQIAATFAAEQRPYLEGLAGDVADDEVSDDALKARLDTYASTAHARFEEGRFLGFVAAKGIGHEQAIIRWNTSAGNVCDLCSVRAGRAFTKATLPGYPGDGGFGGPLCRGGPQCRCVLTYEVGEADD